MKNHEERITLEDSLMTASSKIAEDNIGALSVCLDIVENVGSYDPVVT